MYVFINIKYSLGLNHPGFATTMLGLAKYSLDNAKGPGMMKCWCPDTSTVAEENNDLQPDNYIITKPDPTFSFAIRNQILQVLSVSQYTSNIYLDSVKTMIKCCMD